MSEPRTSSAKWRREVYARVFAKTGNHTQALIAANYKPTKANLKKATELMSNNKDVQKRIMELVAEMYPVTENAENIVALSRAMVEKAIAGGKVNEMVAAVGVLLKIGGVPSGEPSKATQVNVQNNLTLPGSNSPTVSVKSSEAVQAPTTISLPTSSVNEPLKP